MITISLIDPSDFVEWRDQARSLLLADVEPSQVNWQKAGENSLFESAISLPVTKAKHVPMVTREFLELAQTVLAHSDPNRHATLYRMLWRITHGENALLRIATDVDVSWAAARDRQVGRDMHKMKAFVRFREVVVGEQSVYVAWFEPSHDIVTRVAPFFVRRFTGMRWSILTPRRSAHWDGEHLTFGEGASPSDAPAGDALEDLWRTYYANIFNPARLKVNAMRSEMPVRYWKNLPEAQLIPGLIRDALPRMQAMVDTQPTIANKKIKPIIPAIDRLPSKNHDQLRREVQECRRCDLWKPATQTVFGAGPMDARVMLIGEQPGDQEDLSGEPFVGPSGILLNEALEAAGVDRNKVYVTNAVKHFRFEPRGKVRLHKRASAQQQATCRSWLLAEIDAIQPTALVCLGAMAASSIFGSSFRLTEQRGQWFDLEEGRKALATIHPSYLLRLRDIDEKKREYNRFVHELSYASELL